MGALTRKTGCDKKTNAHSLLSGLVLKLHRGQELPKVTEEHLEARRQQILEAAFSCFSRQGFHQTRMADICREAQLSPGTVYRYFRSKEEIIEVSCQECQQRQDALVEAAKDGKNTLEVLDQLIDYGFGMLEDPTVQTNTRVNVQLWAGKRQ